MGCWRGRGVKWEHQVGRKEGGGEEEGRKIAFFFFHVKKSGHTCSIRGIAVTLEQRIREGLHSMHQAV